jgi:hypothetical protein
LNAQGQLISYGSIASDSEPNTMAPLFPIYFFGVGPVTDMDSGKKCWPSVATILQLVFRIVAYIFYGFLSVAYVRRRATRGFSRSKLPTKILVQRWLTAESLTLCIAYSPILCFSIERMFLKMPIVFSLPWYALGFILLTLWRPSVPEALRNRVSQ